MAFRPPMVVDDHFRSLPSSPVGMPPKSPYMMDEAMNYAHETLRDGYFCGMGMGPHMPNGMRPRSPFGPGYEPDMRRNGPFPGPFQGSFQEPYQNVDELVRRTNLAVQLVNGQVSHSQRYSQLQPKMCSDGRFPQDFRQAKTIEEIRIMDPTQLDRILQSYRLPTDMQSLRLTSRDSLSTRTARMAKLTALYEFLGATRLSEHERARRNAVIAY